MSTPFRGRPACSCLHAWLPVFEAELKRLNIASGLTIYQLIGGATASAGTHSRGGAFDIQTLPERGLLIARHMGAATWNRTRAQGFTPHAHGVLKGCPHNAPARYQIGAMEAGFNGLGGGGRGGRDDGPRNLASSGGNASRLRTYTAGIAWARARQKPPRVRYRVHVAMQPGDFTGRPVVVRSGPGNHHKAVSTKRHGAPFTASGKTSTTKAGFIWREGINGGWLPDRRLKRK